MSRSKLARGVRKYLRREKARLKREVPDAREREQRLQELLTRTRR